MVGWVFITLKFIVWVVVLKTYHVDGMVLHGLHGVARPIVHTAWVTYRLCVCVCFFPLLFLIRKYVELVLMLNFFFEGLLMLKLRLRMLHFVHFYFEIWTVHIYNFTSTRTLLPELSKNIKEINYLICLFWSYIIIMCFNIIIFFWEDNILKVSLTFSVYIK